MNRFGSQSNRYFWALIATAGIVIVASVLLITTMAPLAVQSLGTATNDCGCGTVAGSFGRAIGPGMIALGFSAILMLFAIHSWRLFSRTNIWRHNLIFTTKAPQRLASAMNELGWHQYTVVRDQEPLAFTAGIIKPKVYVSEGLLKMLSDEELQALLRHEVYHAQLHDPLRFAVSEVIRHSLAWLPGIKNLYNQWRTSRELAADESNVGENNEAALSRSLAKLLTSSRMLAPGVSFFSPSELRIKRLIDPSFKLQKTNWLLPVIGALFLGVVSMVAVAQHNPAQAAVLPSGGSCQYNPQCVIEEADRSVAPVVACSRIASSTLCYIIDPSVYGSIR